MKRASSNEEQGVIDFSPDETDEALRLIQSAPGKYEIFVVPITDTAFISSFREIVNRLPGLIEKRLKSLSEERLEKAIEFLMPANPFDFVEKSIELDNAELRVEFLKQEACLTSADIHKITGQGGSNKSMPASRWKNKGCLFAVPYRGQDYYPEFQFRDGEPLAVIKDILSTLPEDMTPWQTAFWFTSENGWLNGQRPCDMLSGVQAVIKTAEVERENVIG